MNQEEYKLECVKDAQESWNTVRWEMEDVISRSTQYFLDKKYLIALLESIETVDSHMKTVVAIATNDLEKARRS